MNFVDDQQGQFLGSFADFSGGKVGVVKIDAPKGSVREEEVVALEKGLAALKAAEAKAVKEAKAAAEKAKIEAEKSALLKEIKSEIAFLQDLEQRIVAVLDMADKFVGSTVGAVAEEARRLIKDGNALLTRITKLIEELLGAQKKVSAVSNTPIISPANPSGLLKK